MLVDGQPLGAAAVEVGGRTVMPKEPDIDSCVDGSLLARDFWTVMQIGRVLPCVRIVGAALFDGRWP
jgi:hypothetical protein